MPKVRKIDRLPAFGRNYFLLDANFLANKHIRSAYAPSGTERDRVESCHAWWTEIDRQLDDTVARVYIPDVCIAEAFKVLAKKYYREKWFPNYQAYYAARNKLSTDVRMDSRSLKGSTRQVRYHDMSTNRDIIIGIDRFFELFFVHNKKVQIADLILISTAKYLVEFYDIPREHLHIVTLDNGLREGVTKASDLPNAYDPTLRSHRAELVFR